MGRGAGKAEEERTVKEGRGFPGDRSGTSAEEKSDECGEMVHDQTGEDLARLPKATWRCWGLGAGHASL